MYEILKGNFMNNKMMSVNMLVCYFNICVVIYLFKDLLFSKKKNL